MVKRRAAAVDTSEPNAQRRRMGGPDDGPAENDGQHRQQPQAAEAGATHGLQIDPALVAAYVNQAAAAMAASGAAGDEQGQAETAAGGEAGQAPEPSVPDIRVAAAELMKLASIPLESALSALKETQEEVFGEAGSAGGADLLNDWLDAAQVRLACNMEVQAEIDSMRIAMEQSLQEREAQKAAEDVPLVERPAEFLRDRFAPAAANRRDFGAPASIVIRSVTAFTCHHALFAAGDHKAPLVNLAELERKCHRWYPNKGTVRFWEQVAESCVATAAAVPGATKELKLEGWIGCEQGPAGCTVCAAALGRDQGGGAGPSTSAPAPAPEGPPRSAVSSEVRTAALAAVGQFAARKWPEVEGDVCKMPSVPGQIPAVFSDLDDPPGNDDSDDEVIECTDVGPESGRGRHAVEEIS
ncbi:hypothetical protein PLESTB_000696600 [Pleodorina starrii]|uniref:Uncharacterized protein n=1 Tax=Pleodorina starrii TaxID=330485 RepID=A0A9W6F1P2_9CHLO|nr:hypothetical protein PLESTM_001220300 [Pleodorina starrii]GLC52994.1 hypothetical protein PLESTB_000696600 [Pleodorina starrii]GLC65291.1 hypothetical protein PLESTF_000273000 [Pleodorina starrii]